MNSLSDEISNPIEPNVHHSQMSNKSFKDIEDKIEEQCKKVPKKPIYSFIKRIFDILLSLLALILLSPFFLVIAIVIKKDSKGPVFFKQTRVGKKGKLFVMYKFRSMCVDAEERLPEVESKNMMKGAMFKAPNDPRITKIGTFIRRYSIDELPQFINVLKGEMSIVGPRPPLTQEVVRYEEEEYIRLSVTGGLTCYWQISGRSDISFEECVKYDKKYINDRSILTDLKILLRTVPVALFGKGAY